MEEDARYGNPPSLVGDSLFNALGRYLKAKKEGIEHDPADWEEIQNEAGEEAVKTFAEPSEKVYVEYGKLYKGFLHEICRRTFQTALEDDSEAGLEAASALRYETDRTIRAGKPGTKNQLKEVLEKHEEYFNLPVNQTTISGLSSWLKGIAREDKKAKKKLEKLKAAAAELTQTVQEDLDDNAMRRLALREMVQEGKITGDQFEEICTRLNLVNETVE